MKNWLIICSAFLLPILMIACGSSKSGSDQQTYASAPTSLNCLNGTAVCDNNAYANYYGFQAYPNAQTVTTNTTTANRYDISNIYAYSNGNVASYCSCPVGTRPVYNGSIGLGCVNQTVFAPYETQSYYWGTSTAGYNWVNWNQFSNINQTSAGNGCYTNLAWACFIDGQNNCFSGQSCQQINPNSRMGICKSQ